MSLPEFEGPYPQRGAEIPAQWSDTFQLFENAEAAGVLDAPVRVIDARPSVDALAGSALAPARPVTSLNKARLPIVAEQLWLLGYLDTKPRKNISAKRQADDQFVSAVRLFQQEAAITTDGWVGDETWRALGTLVSFETPVVPQDWCDESGAHLRAFRRAIRLRLWSYGLAATRPKRAFSQLAAGTVSDAQAALRSIGALEDDDDWVAVLLDHDRLIRIAGTHGETFEDPSLPAALARLKRRLLVNLAKIELWMLGSDITIDGRDDYPVAGLGVAKVKRRHGSRTRLAPATDDKVRAFLTEYWQSMLELAPSAARQRAAEISPDLFRSLMEPQQFAAPESDRFNEPDYSLEVARYVEQQPSTSSFLNSAFDTVRKIGMRLFDGLRRIWRWITKGARAIARFANNMIRAFFRFALKGYKIVRTAFSAFFSAFEQYMQGRLDLPAGTRSQVRLQKDFDTCVLVNEDDVEAAAAASHAIRRFGAMFNLSCRIVGLIVDLLTSVLTGLAGWARLLMVLVKHYRELVPAYHELVAVIEAAPA